MLWINQKTLWIINNRGGKVDYDFNIYILLNKEKTIKNWYFVTK